MPNRISGFLARGLMLVGVALAAPAGATRIDGLSALEPVSAVTTAATVTGDRLDLALSGNRKLSIAPWPRFLPQRLGKQQLDASRQMLPAGPSDQLSFTRIGETQPWFMVGTGARRSAKLVGAWELQLTDRQWSLSDGNKEKMLGAHDAPAKIAVGRQYWCVYLLEARMPQAQPGIAMEEEPQIAWAALKLNRRQQHC